MATGVTGRAGGAVGSQWGTPSVFLSAGIDLILFFNTVMDS